jgi:hypothetical protein
LFEKAGRRFFIPCIPGFGLQRRSASMQTRVWPFCLTTADLIGFKLHPLILAQTKPVHDILERYQHHLLNIFNCNTYTAAKYSEPLSEKLRITPIDNF